MGLTQSFIRRTSAPLRQTAVTAWCSVFQSCKPLLILSGLVIVISLFCLCWLVCQSFLFFLVSANFLKQFLSVHWLCKLFDKALVVALARVALAMCLQMDWLINYFSSIIYFFNYVFINWSLSFFKTKVCNSHIFIIFKACLV